MRVLPFLAVFLLSPAFCSTSNSLSLKPGSGNQRDRPISVSQVFQPGEIVNYAQPLLDGTALSVWQCDVKVRWRDASVSRGITAIVPTSSGSRSGENPQVGARIRIVAPSHGFLDGETVSISGTNIPELNKTWVIIGASTDSFVLAKSAAAPASNRTKRVISQPSRKSIITNGIGTVTGPDYGSLKHAIVSFTASLSSSKPTTLTFRNNTDPSSGGVALGQDEMLNFNVDWGAAIQATQGNTTSISVRDMLGTHHWRYWLQGPVVTQVIVEDRSSTLSYDFGWQENNGWKPASDNTHKSLHPIFVLTFYPGWKGVKIEYILENDWTDRLQDQAYSLALKSGRNLEKTRYSRAEFTHIFASRWRKVYWDGDEPGALVIDHNLAYLRQTGAVPYFDVESVQVDDGDISKALSEFQKSDGGGDYGDAGQYNRVFGTTGGRPEIGWFPRWFMQFLYRATPNSWKVFEGHMDIGGHIPMHFREVRTKKLYSDYDSMDAFGRPLSLTARPTVFIPYAQSTYWNDSYVAADDRIQPVGPTSWNSWSVDLAHSSSFAYVPYLITGDWYLLEELQFWAAHAVAFGNPKKSEFYGRGREWGILNPDGVQPRGTAWGLRTLLHAAFITPSNTPEEKYFRQKVANNAHAWEGRLNITDGRFISDFGCNSYSNGSQSSEIHVNDIGCFGRKVMESGLSNPLYFPTSGTIWGDCARDAYSRARLHCDLSNSTERNYMDHMLMLALGEADRMGFPDFSASFEKLKGHYIDRVMHPDNADTRQFLLSSYSIPVLNGDNSSYLSTWSAVNAVLTRGSTTLTESINSSSTSFTVANGADLIAFQNNKPLNISKAVSNGANTDITITGHGVDSSLSAQRIMIIGGKGDWKALDGVYWITYVDPNTLRIALNSANFSAYQGGATATLNIVGSGYNVLRIGSELMRACAVMGNTVYIGPSGDGSCPGANARGTDGAKASAHSVGDTVTPSYDYWEWLYLSEGYAWMARATLSYTPGSMSPNGYSGEDAWNWIYTQLKPYQSVLNGDPRWAIIPEPKD